MVIHIFLMEPYPHDDRESEHFSASSHKNKFLVRSLRTPQRWGTLAEINCKVGFGEKVLSLVPKVNSIFKSDRWVDANKTPLEKDAKVK